MFNLELYFKSYLKTDLNFEFELNLKRFELKQNRQKLLLLSSVLATDAGQWGHADWTTRAHRKLLSPRAKPATEADRWGQGHRGPRDRDERARD